MALLEKEGVPTVSLVSAGFAKAWKQSATAFGLAALPMVQTAHTFTNASAAEIENMVDTAMAGLIGGITGALAGRGGTDGGMKVEAADIVTAEGGDQLDALAAMNSLFLQNDWGDGFPLVPPTRRAVERMVASTRRDPLEVIALLEPSFGISTVERIAINAVMAGCAPEHLPVLITAVKAIAQPRFMLRDAAVSTAGRAPLLLVNGPIVRRLGINARVGALGPGAQSQANVAIGRAMRLIYMNIAGAHPGSTDPSTVGLPTKFSLCVAENEEDNPWEPYHVERGFSRDASTVTVKSVYGCTETLDVKSTTPERITDVAVSAARYIGTPFGDWITGGTSDPDRGVEVCAQHMWLICPDHAAKLAAGGWSKDDVRTYLWKNATIPLREILTRRPMRVGQDRRWAKHPELQWMEQDPDREVPMYAGPESFQLAVVGGPGPRGVFFWGNEEAITQQIEE